VDVSEGSIASKGENNKRANQETTAGDA